MNPTPQPVSSLSIRRVTNGWEVFEADPNYCGVERLAYVFNDVDDLVIAIHGLLNTGILGTPDSVKTPVHSRTFGESPKPREIRARTAAFDEGVQRAEALLLKKTEDEHGLPTWNDDRTPVRGFQVGDCYTSHDGIRTITNVAEGQIDYVLDDASGARPQNCDPGAWRSVTARVIAPVTNADFEGRRYVGEPDAGFRVGDRWEDGAGRCAEVRGVGHRSIEFRVSDSTTSASVWFRRGIDHLALVIPIGAKLVRK